MRNLLWILLASVLAAACEGAPAASGPATPDAADGSQRTYGLNLKLTENGVLKADLFGDTAFQRPDSDVTELRGVNLTFYDAQGKTPSKLTSKTGEYDARTAVMVARGGVVLVTQNEKGQKRVIRSEELHYDQRGDRVWSERETIVEENGQTLVTDGFTSDTRFTHIRGRNGKTTGVRVNASGREL